MKTYKELNEASDSRMRKVEDTIEKMINDLDRMTHVIRPKGIAVSTVVDADGKGWESEAKFHISKLNNTISWLEDMIMRIQMERRGISEDQYSEEDESFSEGIFDTIKNAFMQGVVGELEKSIDPKWHKIYGVQKVDSLKQAKDIIKKAKQAGHLIE
jgi:hypothetical protein